MTRPWIWLAVFALVMLVVIAPPGGHARAEMLSFRSPDYATGRGRPMQVKADLARSVESWRGRRSCGSPARAHNALRPVIARWLGTQAMARPGRVLAHWGYHSGQIWLENRIVGGKPFCSAGFRKVIAYAKFR